MNSAPARSLFSGCVALAAVGCFASCSSGIDRDYFVVRIVDEDTGRGVPLVELTLLNDTKYWTDSAGIAALNEPSMAGHNTAIVITSHGYEYPENFFFGNDVFTEFRTGAITEIAVRRKMVAERLYRLTGEGIYRDSVLAGLPVPIEHPMVNSNVVGQDTASTAIYRDELFWVWGDTILTDSIVFEVTAATSSLADDPATGIDYEYFTDRDGRTRAMLPIEGEGLVWIEGLAVLKDPDDRERLIATYTVQDGLTAPHQCGLALFNDDNEIFERWVERTCTRNHQSSHPVLHDGYWYFYPSLRVTNDWDSIQDELRWEQREVTLPPNVGEIQSRHWISAIAWNEYRQRWIALLENFGRVYYSEAMQPEGPWSQAVQIIEHDNYNFYNVAMHPYFNAEGGRIIYLEGTYTDSFTNAAFETPRYNYNQIMYRLDLADPRLAAAQD